MQSSALGKVQESVLATQAAPPLPGLGLCTRRLPARPVLRLRDRAALQLLPHLRPRHRALPRGGSDRAGGGDPRLRLRLRRPRESHRSPRSIRGFDLRELCSRSPIRVCSGGWRIRASTAVASRTGWSSWRVRRRGSGTPRRRRTCVVSTGRDRTTTRVARRSGHHCQSRRDCDPAEAGRDRNGLT